jgi:hypothetical protein
MIPILAIVAGSIISVALVSTAIVFSGNGNKPGNIKTVDFRVYWDRGCTNLTSTLNWGTMEPNTTKNFTVYVKNTGTIPERLSMRTSNWNPTTAQKYVTLTWNREDTILDPASNITATFTLRVLSNVTNLVDFRFDITLTGAQRKS